MEHCDSRKWISPVREFQSLIMLNIIIIITIKYAPGFQRPSHVAISRNTFHPHVLRCTGCHKRAFTQERVYLAALREDEKAEVFLPKVTQLGPVVTKRVGISHSRSLLSELRTGRWPLPFSKIKTLVPAHSSGPTRFS